MTKQNFHFRWVKVKRLVEEETSLLLPPPGSSILVQTTLCHPAACKTIWRTSHCIGLDLSRAVGRLVMLEWDQRFLRLARDNQLNIFMYKRYVDDSAEGMEALKPGVRWSEEEKRMILHPHLVEEDLLLEPDLRSMREVVKMGNSIYDMVQLTGDCPSENSNGKMPLLDTEVWVEGNVVQYNVGRRATDDTSTHALPRGS